MVYIFNLLCNKVSWEVCARHVTSSCDENTPTTCLLQQIIIHRDRSRMYRYLRRCFLEDADPQKEVFEFIFFQITPRKRANWSLHMKNQNTMTMFITTDLTRCYQRLVVCDSMNRSCVYVYNVSLEGQASWNLSFVALTSDCSIVTLVRFHQQNQLALLVIWWIRNSICFSSYMMKQMVLSAEN